MVFLAAEYLRYRWPWAKNLFTRIFFPLLRENEKYTGLTGATLFFISTTLVVVIFEKEIAVPAILISSVADSLAAVVGVTVGRHRFLAKSREGSITFFLCGVLVLFIFVPGLPAVDVLLVAGALALLEALAIPFNDNLAIPLAAALTLKIFL